MTEGRCSAWGGCCSSAGSFRGSGPPRSGSRRSCTVGSPCGRSGAGRTSDRAGTAGGNGSQSQNCCSGRNQPVRDLTHLVRAAVSLPQAGDQEADHNETEDQQSGHDQTQKRHIARPVPNAGGGRVGHSCGGQGAPDHRLKRTKGKRCKGQMVSPGMT